MLKRYAKSIFNHLAAKYGQHTRSNDTGKLWILMYHRILPEKTANEFNEEPGMYVTPETFKCHLKWLCELMKPTKLKDWVTNKNYEGEPTGKSFAITFDDGWQDNYQYAYPVLKDLNIPATIFIVNKFIGTQKIFWPNRIAMLVPYLSDANINSPTLDMLRNKLNIDFTKTDFSDTSSIIATAKKYDDLELTQWLDTIEKELNIDDNARQLLNWDEIEEMLDSNIIDIGGHTRHHIRLLNSISNEVIDDEVIGNKADIEKQINKNVDLFCYPNGDFTQYTEQIVSHNFSAAVTTKYGINNFKQNNHQLLRIGIHQDISANRRDFLAKLSGWR